MRLKLKPGFRISESYVGLAADCSHDSVSVDKAWVVMFRDRRYRIEEVGCYKDGGYARAIGERVPPGVDWQEIAHRLFIEQGWESPWEGYE